MDKIVAFHKATAKKNLFTDNGKPFPKELMSRIAENGALDIKAKPLPGVCVADADVRILPAATALFSSAEVARGERGLLKLDQLQNSTVKPGEPIAIFSFSKDNKWAFIATGAVAGWVGSEKTAFVDDEFIDKFTRASYSVFVSDNVRIRDNGGAVVATAKMGTILPSEEGRLLMPVRGKNGMAAIMRCKPDPKDISPFPAPFTLRGVSRAINNLLGEPYGWGGSHGLRDCSAMTKDYFSIFGVWLPRNSGDQAMSAASILLKGLPAGEKLRKIAENGVPFTTLIHMPGHIMIYLGVYDGEPVVLHNVWGVRVNAADGKVGRAVIGRTVVSSLRAGAEIEARPKGSLFIDNVSRMVFPTGSAAESAR
jgi:cell wall-associated NlpC family hydrolase